MRRSRAKPRTKATAGLLLLAVVAAGGCAPPEPASLAVRYRRGPIEIDGSAGEAAWREASRVALSSAREYGWAQVLWDHEHLYLTATCRFADRIRQDSLILQVSGQRRVHFKFEPDGMCWDLRAAGPRPATFLPEILTYATTYTKQGQWTIEARVPLLAIGAVGSPVTLQLARIGVYTDPAHEELLEPVRTEQSRRLAFDYGQLPRPTRPEERPPAGSEAPKVVSP